jgi:hypothetical protein
MAKEGGFKLSDVDVDDKYKYKDYIFPEKKGR